MGRERRVERGREGMIENILKTIYFIKITFYSRIQYIMNTHNENLKMDPK